MGDVADMMLDGTLCQECGVFLGPSPAPEHDWVWEPSGFPESCEDCEGEK